MLIFNLIFRKKNNIKYNECVFDLDFGNFKICKCCDNYIEECICYEYELYTIL